VVWLSDAWTLVSQLGIECGINVACINVAWQFAQQHAMGATG
jgi:hypothetical protein